MRKSIWFPRWYVVVPVLLPALAIGWFWLGTKLGIDVGFAPDDMPPPPAKYPAWFMQGYNGMLYYLFAASGLEIMPATNWIRWSVLGGHPLLGRSALLLLIVFYVLVLYAISVFGKARQRRRSSKYELIF